MAELALKLLMTRRNMYNFISLPFLIAALDKAEIKFRDSPTMDQLIFQAESGKHQEYYSDLLATVLEWTGEVLYGTAIFGPRSQKHAFTNHHKPYGKAVIQDSFTTLVPEKFLEAWLPEDRDRCFPRGIPFRAI